MIVERRGRIVSGCLPVALAVAGWLAGMPLAPGARAEPADSDLLATDDDLLGGGVEGEPAESSETTGSRRAAGAGEATAEHEKLFAEGRYPSATVCRTCHVEHYREWAMSQHAYAQLSPVWLAVQGTILKRTNVTLGDGCVRCHNPVGANLGEPLLVSALDRHPTSREGVTCVICHRVAKPFGKANGRLSIQEGALVAPVWGPTGNAELKRVLATPDEYRVTTTPGGPGRAIHPDVVRFESMTTSAFCATCHDVSSPQGLRLEDTFSDYQNSPAAARGVTCQDCHMGTEPGVPSGYATAPAAIVGGVPTRPRKRTDHRFAGPDYSVIHPGLFPHNSRAQELATMREWLSFDVEAGWGTPEFERQVAADRSFPPRWRTVDDRYDARAILDENSKSLAEMAEERKKILRVGYRLEEIVVERADAEALRFEVRVRNGTDGHNVPTGLDTDRVVFLQVTVTDADGRVVFRSGDTDPNGDVRDAHSVYVHSGDLPLDEQLFALRSEFTVSMVRGGEREQVLPLPLSLDALPFLRPEPRATGLTGEPLRTRKHKRSLPPAGERWAIYEVPASDLVGSRAPYRGDVKLVAGGFTIHAINTFQAVGFDYSMSAREIGRRLFAGYQVLWEKEFAL